MFLNKLKQSLKQVTNNQGFSLIELLVVVGIMGLLVTVAIPILEKSFFVSFKGLKI